MTSLLKIKAVERLQDEIVREMHSSRSSIGIYVSLNKTQRSMEKLLVDSGVDTSKLFFIDCVTTEKTRDDVLHIMPDQLDLLSAAIKAFAKDISGQKFLLIDALSTLLIYNNENKVARFVQELTEYAANHEVEIIAFSPATQGEELLDKIFNFFDKVER